MTEPDLSKGINKFLSKSRKDIRYALSLNKKLCVVKGQGRLNENNQWEFKDEGSDVWELKHFANCISDVKEMRKLITKDYEQKLREELERVSKIIKSDNKTFDRHSWTY